MFRKGFQLLFDAAGAAGAGAGAGAADEKAGTGDGAKGAKGDDGKHGAGATAGAVKTADEIAAEKKTADDAAAATAAKGGKGGKQETAEEKTAREAKEAIGAPEKYELKIEKDAASFIDDADLKTIEAFARDKGLTNDQAQALVDQRANALLEQSAVFRTMTEADPEIGGDKLADTEKFSKIALDKLYPKGTKHGDEMRGLLVKTGYGNHRVIVRHFALLGRQQAEDSPNAAGAQAGGGGQKTASEVMYGDDGASGTISKEK